MRYIVRCKYIAGDAEVSAFEKCGASVLYVSKLTEFVGVEVDNPECLNTLNFVEEVSISRQGKYADGEFCSMINFTPPMRKSLLQNADLVGWGTNIHVLDSGSNYHGVTRNTDFTNTTAADMRKHGTYVSMIAHHFARGAKIISMKIGHDNPDELAAAQALEQSIDENANVINMSFEFKKHKPNERCVICDLLTHARNAGIAIIAAAGNEGPVDDTIICPGISPDALTVSAVDNTMKITPYSSSGVPGGSKPNICAPGTVQIDGMSYTGTSFAAPIVTGIVASLLPICNFDINKVFRIIVNTGQDIHEPRHRQGHGLINIERIVEVINNEKASSELAQ